MITDNPVEGIRLPPESLVDRHFLLPPDSTGQRFRSRIVELVGDYKDGAHRNPALAKFRCIVNNDWEEIVAYNDIVDFIERDETWQGIHSFRRILKHEGPLEHDDPRYLGSKYNVLVEWEENSTTWEPVFTIDRKTGLFHQDPVTVSVYCKENDLQDTDGWKMCKRYVKNAKILARRHEQVKLHSYRTRPVYQYGVQVPRNHAQAMELDRENGNNLWRESELKELAQIDEYDTFTDLGKGAHPGKDYKRINVHIVYAVKHDGRRKSRLVAGGHLTDTPIESVYSSVVSLRGIRLVTFLAELNEMELWGTDIGNAYLESYTQEKVYIVGGPEFGDREGHTLVITKALYGLKSSGLRWHERFADVLRTMNFTPSKAEPDIWMRDRGDHYEYIAVYVDDLLIASRDAQSIIDDLTITHKFKLKGTGPLSFHLGCDYWRDSDGVLCAAPRKYIDKLLANYERLFGKKPRPYSSPLEEGDHPELDESPLLDIEDTKIYQSLIGSLQWVIQIGRFDVATAVMTLSRFRAAPRQGHLERAKRIFGYLHKMKHAIIRIRTDEPDFSDIPVPLQSWEYTVYAGAKEEIPKDVPRSLGKRVKHSTFVDANLYHDLVSGRSVSGIIHFLNKTPYDWYSKLQTTVETATFGSEYVAARIAVDQIVDIRHTLRYLGVPVEGPSMLFGDNESVVNTASNAHSKLQKRHNALSYHRVREALAAGIILFFHVRGKLNPADILSKHWSYANVWPLMKPILFWQGDTSILSDPFPNNSAAIPSVNPDLIEGSDRQTISIVDPADSNVSSTPQQG